MADNLLRRETYMQGDTIFKEGAEGNTAYIIQSGEVQIVKEIDGRTKVLATIGQGGMFGEMALIDAKPRMASARASKGSSVIIVTEHMFQNKLSKADPFIRGLLTILADHVRNSPN